jgi:hypothetical protein
MATEQEDFDKRSLKDQTSTPKPDPTALTSEALKDAIGSLRTLIDQRINASEALFFEKIAAGVQGGLALKELIASQIADLREVLNERYATQTKALDAAFLAQQAAVATSFDAQRDAIAAALLAAKEAVEKANVAAEKRFDAMNESLSQVNSSTRDLLPRAEAEVRFVATDSRLTEIKSTIDKGFTGVDVRHAGVVESRDVRADSRGNIAIIVSVIAAAAALLLVIVTMIPGH